MSLTGVCSTNGGCLNGIREDSRRRTNARRSDGKSARHCRVFRALKNAGFTTITAICGEEGVQLLERVSTFFFSDLEERVLNRHIEELKAGHIIVGIETPANRVDEAVSVATQHGARRLVHFGLLTITWHTK
jgi:hypothetical protein